MVAACSLPKEYELTYRRDGIGSGVTHFCYQLQHNPTMSDGCGVVA